MILADFIPKIPDSCFNCPLSIASKWTSMDCLRCNVSKKVDALSNKVDVVLASLVVELLKFFHKPTKQSVSVLEICGRYNPLL